MEWWLFIIFFLFGILHFLSNLDKSKKDIPDYSILYIGILYVLFEILDILLKNFS